MATCPDCGVSSRINPSGFALEQVIVAKPLGSFSLAGAQTKVSATSRVQLSHSCGWSVVGRVDADGNNLIVDPKEQ